MGITSVMSPTGTALCSGVEQPGSHEAKTASTQWSPVPQPHPRPGAAGYHPALSFQHQEVGKMQGGWSHTVVIDLCLL